MENEQEQLSKKQLAAWLRRRFEGRCPRDILANLSDDQLIEMYKKNSSEKVKLISEKAAGDGSPARAVSKW
jgi:hypothetical protein